MPNQDSGKKTVHQGRPKQILIILKKEGRLRTNELVQRSGISRTNLCTYIKLLEDEGYVKTIPDTRPGHRMKRYKEITPAGLMFLEGLYKDTPEGDDFYVHEKIKKEAGDVNYGEYKRMKKEELETEMDDLLGEDI